MQQTEASDASRMRINAGARSEQFPKRQPKRNHACTIKNRLLHHSPLDSQLKTCWLTEFQITLNLETDY
jgi:hypothetical protein